MKIVKKSNGNIVIINTDGTVKQVIQQTGVQMLNEGNQVKLYQGEYPIAYIDASEVTHTQIEPAAQVAFNGDNSSLMTLLAEDFFVLSTATDTGGFVETEIDVTSAQILAMGATPIELLPAPGTGKYYNYSGFLEYTAGGTPYSFGAGESYGVTHNYGGGMGSYAGSWDNTLGSTDFILPLNGNPNYYNDITMPSTLLKSGTIAKNEPIVLTTWNGTDPTLGDGTIKVKIKYKVITFG